MRASGWIRVWVVFAVIMWGLGVADMLRDGAPPLLPSLASGSDCRGDFACALGFGSGAASWRADWAQWLSDNTPLIAWVIARPVAYALAAALVLGALVWVVRGFLPKKHATPLRNAELGAPAPALRNAAE